MKKNIQFDSSVIWINKKRITNLAKCTAASWLLALLVSCQGLQRYKEQPLDLSTHSSKWLERVPDTGKVMDYVKHLDSQSSSTSGFNPSDGVSQHEARLIAMVYNPDLRVARLKAKVSTASAKFAGLWDDPTVSFDVLKVTKGVPKPWTVGSSISLTVPLSGRLKVEKAKAKSSMYAELDRVAEEEWKVAHQLQNTWLEWSALKNKLEQTNKVVSALEPIVESSKQLAEQGEIPKTEATLFSIEQTSRKVERNRLVGEARAKELELRGLMGLSPTAPVRLSPSMHVSRQTPSPQRLAINNPTLNRLRSEYKVAETDLILEIRKQYPDLVIGPQAEKDQGQSSIGFLGVIPIPSFNANKGGIAKAKVSRQVARAAFETEYERKVGKMAALVARSKSLQSQNTAMKSTLIPMVDQQLLDSKKLISLGEGNSLILLESLVRSHDAKLQAIDIRMKQAEVEAEIHYLLGPTKHRSLTSK